MAGAVIIEPVVSFDETFGFNEWGEGDFSSCSFDPDDFIFLPQEDLKFADEEMKDVDFQDLVEKLAYDESVFPNFLITSLDAMKNEPLSPDSAISCNYSSPSSPESQSTDHGKLSPTQNYGSMSDTDSPEHVTLFEIYPDTSNQDECIVEEINEGINLPVQQEPCSTDTKKLTNKVLQIKPETRQVSPCSVKQLSSPHIKCEQTITAPNPCAVRTTNVVRNVKLPLPRNSKQSPIFIHQSVDGNIPLQTLLPMTTTQPQIQTVNLISNAQGTILKPVLVQTALAGNSRTCIPVTQNLPMQGMIPGTINTTIGIVNNQTNILPGVTKSTSQSEVNMKVLRRQQRMIKNRESACLSRRKKKEYLQSLEAKLNETLAQNEQIRQENEILKKRLIELETENNAFKGLTAGGRLGGNVVKSTCVLAVLFFLAVNFKGIGILPGSSKETPGLIASSPVVHRGRALLEYTEKYNIHIDNISGAKQSKQQHGDETGQDRRHRKKSLLKKLLKKGLVTERNNRKTVDFAVRNITQLIASVCKPSNETENNRLNEVLELMIRNHEIARISDQLEKHKYLLNKEYAQSPIVELAMKIKQNTTSRNNLRSFILKSSTSKELQVASRHTSSFRSFQQAFNRKGDTFYVVSFRKDHLMFPATEFNSTKPPKLSFIVPASSSSDSKWKVKKNYIAMMQMDCQLTNTKRILLKRSSVPPNIMDMSYLYTPFVNSEADQN